ncbi:hypothetical protein EVAR_59123_1 [Eumeta japonica]|uniref:Uncharacterized protein n=1 Tax=Eumeta variegata TaxID=151549 RepID=A0A4C1ZKU3_EUMVA|nr:hypothetical protein EVAR_59123_1 [Eumeta japonica]
MLKLELLHADRGLRAEKMKALSFNRRPVGCMSFASNQCNRTIMRADRHVTDVTQRNECCLINNLADLLEMADSFVIPSPSLQPSDNSFIANLLVLQGLVREAT